MKYICKIIQFQHGLCSCGINNHYYHQTGNTGSLSSGLTGLPLIVVMKESLRAEAASRPRWTVLGWGGDGRGAQGDKWPNTT